jgi:hypothetical protein
MTTKQIRWAAALVLAGVASLVRAEEVVWRAVTPPQNQPVVVARSAVDPRRDQPDSSPAASLGRPVPLARPSIAAGPLVPRVRAQAADSDPPDPLLSSAPPPPTPPPGADSNIIPTGGIAPIQPPIADVPGGKTMVTANVPPDPPPPASSPFPPPDVTPGMVNDQPMGASFWDKCLGWMTWGDKGNVHGRGLFASDHCFDCMISPVTQPFYFEDPRALTELRPIFMYQSVPRSTPHFNGGSLYFFGTQGRLAISDRFSIVLNELGWLNFSPKDPVPPVEGRTGFAEIKIGPKWTFLRNSETGSVAAAGLTFEIPTGSRRIFQDTGTLGLNPYVSYGQTFGRLPNGFGAVNFLGTLGYDFATDSQRSEFLHAHLHLDYNIANIGLFPLVEFNWMHYTRVGRNVDLGTEGADLVNFGSTTRSKDYFSVAFGARYRFTECIFAGAAIEFPVSNERGLDRYRLTLDLIFRY